PRLGTPSSTSCAGDLLLTTARRWTTTTGRPAHSASSVRFGTQAWRPMHRSRRTTPSPAHWPCR
ncbi:unnamed protein product, partial [Mycena citricolor]